jgi:hypothetical protein
LDALDGWPQQPKLVRQLHAGAAAEKAEPLAEQCFPPFADQQLQHVVVPDLGLDVIHVGRPQLVSGFRGKLTYNQLILTPVLAGELLLEAGLDSFRSLPLEPVLRLRQHDGDDVTLWDWVDKLLCPEVLAALDGLLEREPLALRVDLGSPI